MPTALRYVSLFALRAQRKHILLCEASRHGYAEKQKSKKAKTDAKEKIGVAESLLSS